MMNVMRVLTLGLALATGFLHAPLQAREPELFYYVAVPSAPADCLCIACARFKAGDTKKRPFFTLWRSGYWQEKAPSTSQAANSAKEVAKALEAWTRTLQDQARKTVGAKPETAQYPASLVDFLVTLETLKISADDKPLVVEPLFKNPTSVGLPFLGWNAVDHMDLRVLPDTLGGQERSKRLLQSIQAPASEQSMDFGQWMISFLEKMGTPVLGAHYYPEYNVLVFVAGADFGETMKTLFSTTQ
jgi:hypothetical protein